MVTAWVRELIDEGISSSPGRDCSRSLRDARTDLPNTKPPLSDASPTRRWPAAPRVPSKCAERRIGAANSVDLGSAFKLPYARSRAYRRRSGLAVGEFPTLRVDPPEIPHAASGGRPTDTRTCVS